MEMMETAMGPQNDGPNRREEEEGGESDGGCESKVNKRAHSGSQFGNWSLNKFMF